MVDEEQHFEVDARRCPQEAVIAANRLGEVGKQREGEITQPALPEAFGHPPGIDINPLNAQPGQRILHRPGGYKVTGLLWGKVRKRVSAGTRAS